MARKNKFSKFSLSETLRNIIMLVPNIISILSNVATLVTLETRLAGRAVVSLLVLTVVYATLLVSTWICLLAILFIYLTATLQWSSMLALGALLGINILCLIIVGYVMTKIKKHLFFPGTRSECKHLCETVEDNLME